MRTTLRIDDDLFVRLREMAGPGHALSDVVNQVLRAGLRGGRASRSPFVQRTTPLGPVPFDLSRTNDIVGLEDDSAVVKAVFGP